MKTKDTARLLLGWAQCR